MKAPTSKAEFINTWNQWGSASTVATALGISERAVHRRRRKIEADSNQPLVSVDERARPYSHMQPIQTSINKIELGILDQTIIVFSDAHFWPGEYTTAYKGLLWAIKELKPHAVISNGDSFDGASVSRHPPLGWNHTPSVIEELTAVQAHLGEIEETAKAARHCIIKHRYKSGVHATHNNTVNAGISIVTGHLHSLKVTPFADYNGNRYGVDTGTLAEPYGPQFDYGEGNPLNHRSGFAVLTFKDGKLLWPELVHKWSDTQVEFRGKVINL